MKIFRVYTNRTHIACVQETMVSRFVKETARASPASAESSGSLGSSEVFTAAFMICSLSTEEASMSTQNKERV